MNYRIVPATAEHCHIMAPYMREIDKQEVWASSMFMPIDALLYSLSVTDKAYTVFIDGDEIPVFIFGVENQKNIFDKKRTIWLLGTNKMEKIKKSFVKESSNYLEELLGSGEVHNYIMEGNKQSLRWLKYLGFTILDPKPYGWLNKPFRYVRKVYV